jgi:hypothetical protein
MKKLLFTLLLLGCSTSAENVEVGPNEAFVKIFVEGFDNSDEIITVDIQKVYESELDSSFIYADTSIFLIDNNRLKTGDNIDAVISVDSNKKWFLEDIY